MRSLSTIGEENVKLTVRRLLSHIISNKLAQEINWIEKVGNVTFSKLLLNTMKGKEETENSIVIYFENVLSTYACIKINQIYI